MSKIIGEALAILCNGKTSNKAFFSRFLPRIKNSDQGFSLLTLIIPLKSEFNPVNLDKTGIFKKNNQALQEYYGKNRPIFYLEVRYNGQVIDNYLEPEISYPCIIM